ncbi:hypothetical protein, partial [Kitasatospora herbaricolor]|uniref:hypothetical protein n=1 Tax=Kitasatospora herbaricolor TaxID=68217 RepID=UPI0036DA265B
LVLLVGVILFAIGAGAFLVATLPSVRSGWESMAPDAAGSIASAFAAPAVAPGGPGWLPIAAVLVLLLLIVLLVVFIVRQGHGQTSRLIDADGSDDGRTVIDAAFAEQALRDALRDRPELISASVSTYRVRSAPVLKIAVICRRGVSPKDIADLIEARLRSLDVLIGREIPALIQISGGLRTRLAPSTRLQ